MCFATEFPYPELLDKLPKCNVVHLSEYFKLRPHKSIELMVKMDKQKNGYSGIYILVKNGMLNDLQKNLSRYKEVYNLHDASDPWLFIDESSPVFSRDKTTLVEWIKSIK